MVRLRLLALFVFLSSFSLGQTLIYTRTVKGNLFLPPGQGAPNSKMRFQLKYCAGQVGRVPVNPGNPPGPTGLVVSFEPFDVNVASDGTWQTQIYGNDQIICGTDMSGPSRWLIQPVFNGQANAGFEYQIQSCGAASPCNPFIPDNAPQCSLTVTTNCSVTGGPGPDQPDTTVTVNAQMAVPNAINFGNILLPPANGTVINFLLNGNQAGAYLPGNGNPNTCLSGTGSYVVCGGVSGGGVSGATTGGGLVLTGTTLGLIRTCTTNQYLLWNGASWVCATPGGGGGGGLPTTAQYDLFASTGAGGAQASGVLAAAGFLRGQVFLATGDVTSAAPQIPIAPNASVEYFPTGASFGGVNVGATNGLAAYFSHSGKTAAGPGYGNGGVMLGGGNSSGTNYQVYVDCESAPALGCDFKVPVTYNGGSLGGGGSSLPTIPSPNLFASNGVGGAEDSGVMGQAGFLRAYVLEATGTGNASPFSAPNGSIEYFQNGGYGVGGTNGVAIHFSHSGVSGASGNGGIALGGGNTSGANYQIYLDCEGTPVPGTCDFKVPVTYLGGSLGGGGGGVGGSGAIGTIPLFATTSTLSNSALSDNGTNVTSTEPIITPIVSFPVGSSNPGTATATNRLSTSNNFLAFSSYGGAYVTIRGVGVNGTAVGVNTGGAFFNFNDTTPAAPANGKNVSFQLNGVSISANIPGNGNAATCLSGTGAYVSCGGGTGGVNPATIGQFANYTTTSTVSGSTSLTDNGTQITSTEPIAAPQFITTTPNVGASMTASGGTLPTLGAGTGGIGIGPNATPMMNLGTGAGWIAIPSGAALPTIPANNIYVSNAAGGAVDSGVQATGGFVQSGASIVKGTASGSPFTGANASQEWYGVNGTVPPVVFANGAALFVGHSGVAGNGGIALGGGNNTGTEQIYLDCEVAGCDFKVPVTQGGNPIGGASGSGTVLPNPGSPAPSNMNSSGSLSAYYGSWAASRAYTAGALLLDSNGNVQRCSTAGTSGTSAPTWQTAVGNTTPDGTGALVWTVQSTGGTPNSTVGPANSVYVNQFGPIIANSGLIQYSTTVSAAPDVAIQRAAAGVLSLTSGNQGSTGGALKAGGNISTFVTDLSSTNALAGRNAPAYPTSWTYHCVLPWQLAASSGTTTQVNGAINVGTAVTSTTTWTGQMLGTGGPTYGTYNLSGTASAGLVVSITVPASDTTIHTLILDGVIAAPSTGTNFSVNLNSSASITAKAGGFCVMQ